MQEQLIEWISKNVGAQGSMLAWYWQCAIVVGVILAAYLVDFIFVKAIIPTLRKITSKTNTQVDDILLSEKVVLRHEPVRWIKRVSSCCQIFTIPLVPYRSTGKTLTKQFPASVPHT